MTEAENGAALLDEKVPGWAERIYLDELEISSLDDCVLGQLFGEYHNGMIALFPGYEAKPLVDQEWLGRQHGFDGEFGLMPALGDAWKELIRGRR